MESILAAVVACILLGNSKGFDSGVLNVTLVVFSGVPDPEWLVTPNTANYETIKELLNTAKNVNATYLPQQIPARLGYKGFLVQENDQEARLILGSITKELQQELLRSIPKDAKIPERLKEKLSVVITAGKVFPDLRDLEEDRTKRVAPNYEGATFIWNNNYARLRNNCYNYANDKVTNTFAQPGRESGLMWDTLVGDNIREAAKRDGLLRISPDDIPNVPKHGPRHLVALFVDPGEDFHWYRRDSNRLWSHKPGMSRITNRDGNGDLIEDPRDAETDDYQFVCFMTTNKETVRIN